LELRTFLTISNNFLDSPTSDFDTFSFRSRCDHGDDEQRQAAGVVRAVDHVASFVAPETSLVSKRQGRRRAQGQVHLPPFVEGVNPQVTQAQLVESPTFRRRTLPKAIPSLLQPSFEKIRSNLESRESWKRFPRALSLPSRALMLSIVVDGAEGRMAKMASCFMGMGKPFH
jgi:hypothetical protein